MKKSIFILIGFISTTVFAQKTIVANNQLVQNLKKHIQFLASDVLEGRRAGTIGEQKAALYIALQFESYGLKQKGESLFFQTFTIKKDTISPSSSRMGKNVIGYIDNKAPYTIVLGAHFDHLGYGEDHNSMYKGTEHLIHNGADDNASGTAALLELARLLKKEKKPSYNYLFIAFSGEELGLFGSKYFVEHPTIDLKQVNYMINMDMIGRLNDSMALTIGGVGTSPTWDSIIHKNNFNFKIKIDSSGTGPSDHTSFYRKDIPVLFFFTGLHEDYHKPTDDFDKINYTGEAKIVQWVYQIIQSSKKYHKLRFTKTREVQMNTAHSMKVTLGIMPDYTFNEKGVKVDGVMDDKPAKKSGMQAGDIIIQINTWPVNDLNGYMKILSNEIFKKGYTTTVIISRKNQFITLPITF